MDAAFTFTGECWLYEGEAAWHFATLPAEVADEIADRKSESYLLPLKAEVRRREGFGAGDRVTVTLDLRE